MEFWSVLLLAVGLAMDAAAASATRGLLIDRIRLRHVLAVAIAFGGFQAAMPALGWALGAQLGPALEAWDHWVAFALLAAIGLEVAFEPDGGTQPPIALIELRGSRDSLFSFFLAATRARESSGNWSIPPT
jgi:hypothetical protein